jgi:hypothetical protein
VVGLVEEEEEDEEEEEEDDDAEEEERGGSTVMGKTGSKCEGESLRDMEAGVR